MSDTAKQAESPDSVASHECDTTNYKMLDSAFWTQTTPHGFLDTLQKYVHRYVFVVDGLYPDSSWLAKADVNALQTRTSDKTESAFVMSVYESAIHPCSEYSTVGYQAKYLLRAINEPDFFPSLCSASGEQH